MKRGPYRSKNARFSYTERSAQNGVPPLCACGCGQKVKWDGGRCRWRTFAARDHYHPPGLHKDADWLRARYVDDGLTTAEIGALCGVTQSVVIRWMRHLGVPRRGASERLIGRQVGARNPSWKGGVTPERQRLYKSQRWKALIGAVFARDGYRCVRCRAGKRKRGGLHAHHVVPWADAPELRFYVENIVTLCDSCHLWVHSKANRESEFLQAA